MFGSECYGWYDIANIQPPPTISLVFSKGTIYPLQNIFIQQRQVVITKTNGRHRRDPSTFTVL